MALTIILPPESERKLAERAAALGKDPAGYVQQLVEKDMEQATFAELFAPVHRAVKDSGITGTELDSLLASALADSREHRRNG